MKVFLTDGTGRWLSLVGAKRYKETTWYWSDGKFGDYHISYATNRWDVHEELYELANVWLKHRWDDNKLSPDEWTIIPKSEAARWFAANKYEEPPESLREEYEKLRLL